MRIELQPVHGGQQVIDVNLIIFHVVRQPVVFDSSRKPLCGSGFSLQVRESLHVLKPEGTGLFASDV
jgi:hypothetical protein